MENKPTMSFWGPNRGMEVAIGIMIFCLPFERIGAIDVHGITLRLSHLAGLGMLGFAAYRYLQQHRKQAMRREEWALLAFLGSALISVATAVELPRAFQAWLYIAFMALVAIALARQQWTQERIEKIMRILWWSTVLVTLFGLFQFVGDMMGLPQILTGLRTIYTKQVFGFPRIQSTALEPLYFANFLLLPAGIFGAALIQKQYRACSEKRLWLVLLLIGLNIVLTLSRGGYLGIIAVGIALLVLKRKALIISKATVLKVGIGGIVVLSLSIGGLALFEQFSTKASLLNNFITQATNTSSGAGVDERTATIQIAQRCIEQHPVFGIGPSSFGPYAEVTGRPPKNGFRIVNNETLELACEHGTVGLALFIVFLGILFMKALQQHNNTPIEETFKVGAVAALLGILVQYQTFSTLYILHIWVTIGFIMAMSSQRFHQQP